MKRAIGMAAVFLLVTGTAFAAEKSTGPKASKADCDKAMENLYKVSGMKPNAEAKKTNSEKCARTNTTADTDCMVKATSMDELNKCKPAPAKK